MFLLLYVMIAFLKKINHYNTHTRKMISYQGTLLKLVFAIKELSSTDTNFVIISVCFNDLFSLRKQS